MGRLRDTAAFALAFVVLGGAVVLGGVVSACGSGGSAAPNGGATASATLSPQTSAAATADARATLRGLFAAWRAKDVAAVKSFVSADRQAVDWASEFKGLDRVKFGKITESPELVDQYISDGEGYATGVAPEDVRCFQADATFFYVPGYQGPADEGQALAYHWFLERDDEGVWKVTDWGF